MKLFSSGKISHRILSMCLAVCMLFSLTVTVAAADNESADLTSLSLSGVSVIDFSPETTEYTAYIPCDFSESMAGSGLTVPEVYYEKASADANVVVDAPDTIGADSAITVTVTNGGAEKTYTINLVPIGQNMYVNGSFETGTNTTFGAPDSFPTSVSVSEEAAYSGSYGLKRLISFHSGTYYQPSASLSSGKTYLTSAMAKIAPENVESRETNDTVRVRIIDEAQFAINSGILTNSKDHTPKTMAVDIYKGDSKETLWPNTPSPGASVMSYGSALGRNWTCFSAVITPTVDLNARVELFAAGHHTVAYTDDYYLGELVVSSSNMTNREGEVVTEIIKPFDESEVETVALTANFYNQTGTKAGLDNLEIIEFSLADDYEDVSINQDGVLSVGCNAPAQIKVITYAEPNLGNNHVQQVVKAEMEIDLRDISTIPIAEVSDVKIKNMSVPNFKSRKFAYTMYLPYNYEPNFPEIILTEADITTFVADEETTCDITVGDGERDEDYLVTIDATNGDIETQYTIKVYLVGENMVADGGLENGDINIVGSADGPTAGLYSLVEENVGVGNYALRTETSYLDETKKNGCTGWGFNPRPVCEAGVTYLTSYMCRLADPEGATYSLTNWIAHDDTVGKIRYYTDGIEQLTNLVPVTSSWQTIRTIAIPNVPGNTSFSLVDPAWTAGNQPPVVSDEHYIGELVIGSINYSGSTQIAIPETGENSYELKAEFFNQFGDAFGVENETVTWDAVGSVDGVRVEDGKIIVTNEAVTGNVRVRATIEPTFSATYTFSNSFELELIPESDTPEIPRADNVKAAGVIKTGETLVGSYDYYNALGIDEGESQYAWFYADTKNGTKTEIPADYDLNEDGDEKTLYIKDETYSDKYIFFEVTPYTVEEEHGKAVVSNYVVKPTAPTVPTITITGNGYIGSTAVATYTFADENGDEEDGSTYRWLRGNSLNGDYTPIEDADGNYFTEKEYTITTADIGKYLRFEVTPKTSAEYEPDGLPTVKNGVLAAAKPEAANVKIENIIENIYRVDFLYSHPLGIPEGVEKIYWYADGEDLGMGVSKTIDGNVNTITVRVIPVASKPPYDGEAVTATLTLNSGGNVVSSRPSSVGGSSNSIGSSIVPAPEVTPVPEQKPVEEVPKHWAADGIEFVMKNGIMNEVVPGDFQNSRIVTRADFIYYVMKTLGDEKTAYNHEFGDVTGDDYFASALQAAVDKGIISKDTNFNPQRSVSRQEVCKILVLAASLKMQQVADLTKFADETSVSEWARGYVGAAVDSGLLKGVSENEFSPLGAITREQTAVILKRLDDYRKGGKLS